MACNSQPDKRQNTPDPVGETGTSDSGDTAAGIDSGERQLPRFDKECPDSIWSHGDILEIKSADILNVPEEGLVVRTEILETPYGFVPAYAKPWIGEYIIGSETRHFSPMLQGRWSVKATLLSHGGEEFDTWTCAIEMKHSWRFMVEMVKDPANEDDPDLHLLLHRGELFGPHDVCYCNVSEDGGDVDLTTDDFWFVSDPRNEPGSHELAGSDLPVEAEVAVAIHGFDVVRMEDLGDELAPYRTYIRVYIDSELVQDEELRVQEGMVYTVGQTSFPGGVWNAAGTEAPHFGDPICE